MIQIKSIIRTNNIKLILVLFLSIVSFICASGAYDHGTATGKGKLQLDFTWNPFNTVEFGQTYLVLGYGLTNRLDLHGYFANQTSGENNYYIGLFYQFLDYEYLDLATAVGIRQYFKSPSNHLFFPQLLYNFKLGGGFTIGGSLVGIREINEGKFDYQGSAFDVSLFVPLTTLIKLPKFIEEFKLAIGAFNPGISEHEIGDFLPTYSLDFKFNWRKDK